MQTCLRLGLTVSDEILYYNTLYIGQLHDYVLIDCDTAEVRAVLKVVK